MKVKGMLRWVSSVRAVRVKNARCKCPKRRCTRRSMPTLGLPDNQCLGGIRSRVASEKGRTKVHDMVAADGTIVDDDVCPYVRLTQQKGG